MSTLLSALWGRGPFDIVQPLAYAARSRNTTEIRNTRDAVGDLG